MTYRRDVLAGEIRGLSQHHNKQQRGTAREVPGVNPLYRCPGHPQGPLLPGPLSTLASWPLTEACIASAPRGPMQSTAHPSVHPPEPPLTVLFIVSPPPPPPLLPFPKRTPPDPTASLIPIIIHFAVAHDIKEGLCFRRSCRQARVKQRGWSGCIAPQML